MPKIDLELESIYELEEPKKYKVLLHNDDYTTMDFVIFVLTTIFHKTSSEATNIMIEVHEKGKSLCGIFTKEIGSAKVNQVAIAAKQNGFPLLATLEAE
ncbi:MAG: ATP-dependent Clp protease adaptor ClpS [Sulfurovaceae bacterium]|nr:ATP-dependent Clp protease adaptor ClpS [Sulfurovaceae bacterium]MDD5549525.1 ATP-dependent Clp protease adaptor ClpS [Sulfurovaceae bacterium]